LIVGDSRTDIIGDWIRANYHRWGNTPAERVARLAACQDDTGATRHYISQRICRMERAGDIPAPGSIPQAPAPHNPSMEAAMTAAGMIDEETLRSQIDVHYKAKRLLESIQPGQFYDTLDKAAVDAGISRSIAREVFLDARYADYVGRAIADQRTIIGHPTRIAAMKAERLLR
jgi:hypothetical protein